MGCDLGLVCGQCQRPCNDCCASNLSLTKEEALRLNDGKRILLKEADGLCRFTDRETKLCTIYDERPRVCRKFNCQTLMET